MSTGCLGNEKPPYRKVCVLCLGPPVFANDQPSVRLLSTVMSEGFYTFNTYLPLYARRCAGRRHVSHMSLFCFTKWDFLVLALAFTF